MWSKIVTSLLTLQAAVAMSGQDAIYDGSDNLLGLVSVQGEESMDAAIKEGRLPVVDRLIPPQTIIQFLESNLWKSLPGNLTPTLPPLTEGNVERVAMPYAEWAPAPYSELPGSAWERVSIRVGSDQDTTGLQIVDKNIHAMKVRLWEGMVPISRNSWRNQGLDDADNFDLACQHLNAVVNTFAYLNTAEVQSALRDVFNNIAGEWGDFENALNAMRSPDEAKVSVTALWEEFFRAKWSVMVTRAHTWIMEHVDELRAPLIERLRQHEPDSFDVYSTEQWNITNKLHILSEIAGRAGFTVMLPMEGYTGYRSHDDETNDTGPNINFRKTSYSENLKFWTGMKQAQREFQHGIANVGAKREYQGIADPQDIVEKYLAQVDAQKMLREQMTRHTTASLEAEDWILSEQRQLGQEPFNYQNWGFVVYRITYEQSEQEWAHFMKVFQADLDDWGEGIMGSSVIKTTAQLKWIDGRDTNIAEGSLKQAERHFLALKEDGSFTDGDWQGDIFLVVDSDSVASYIYPASHPISSIQHRGDYAGFVRAVEAGWSPGDHAEEAPGFTGSMRCAGSLIFSDLFALAKAQVAYPEDLWALAMHHPWQVYVGPVVQKRLELWNAAKQEYSGKDDSIKFTREVV